MFLSRVRRELGSALRVWKLVLRVYRPNWVGEKKRGGFVNWETQKSGDGTYKYSCAVGWMGLAAINLEGGIIPK